MDEKDELLLALRDARRDLKEGRPFRSDEMLNLLEGMAPFLNRGIIIDIKCKSCDNYAKSFFPLEDDFHAVDLHEYCHAKRASLQHLSFSKLAGCMQHSKSSREELLGLAESILEEDLRPAFAERKLYDRSKFATCKIDFQVSQEPGKVCIEFGHRTQGGFVGSNMRLCLLRRLDPGMGAEASEKIALMLKDKPIIVDEASQRFRRMLDIDYILEWIAKKRKMDIVNL